MLKPWLLSEVAAQLNARVIGDDIAFSAVGTDSRTITAGQLFVALAGPQVSRPSGMIPASGRDIVLAMDLSGSMEREDFDLNGAPLSRLDAVKRVASRLVAGREGDRIGPVIFGDRAYFAQPLTFDVAAVARAIDEAIDRVIAGPQRRSRVMIGKNW